MTLLESIVGAVTGIIAQASYLGVFFLMSLESANIPIPSEVILPFAGFLVSQGKLDFWMVSLAGALGCTFGSLVSYYLGRVSQRTWIEAWVSGWGRFFISPEELSSGERWLSRYGDKVVFVSRLMPVVRTFISFPAGVAQVSLPKFTVLTFLGSLIWSIFLTYIGLTLGENWRTLEPIFRQFDLVVIIAVIIALAWFFMRRWRRLG